MRRSDGLIERTFALSREVGTQARHHALRDGRVEYDLPRIAEPILVEIGWRHPFMFG